MRYQNQGQFENSKRAWAGQAEQEGKIMARQEEVEGYKGEILSILTFWQVLTPFGDSSLVLGSSHTQAEAICSIFVCVCATPTLLLKNTHRHHLGF